MKNLSFFIGLFFFIGIISMNFGSGLLICSQDFEDIEWTQGGIGNEFTGWNTWNDHAGITNSNPHNGQGSLRWNQDSSRTDPILGKQGLGNILLDYRGPNNEILGLTGNEMYMSFWFRHDEYGNNAGYSDSARKLFYMVDEEHGVQAMYIKFQHGTESIRLSYANGGYGDDWARDNWGYSGMSFDMSGVDSPGLDGEWVKFAMYVNYVEHYYEFWINGEKLYTANSGSMATYWNTHPEDAALGRTKWDPNLNLHYKGFQFGYFDQNRDCVNCEDIVSGNYHAGIQIDDIEVWDEMPGVQQGCLDGESRSCLTGGLGICSAGIEICLDGVYSTCVQSEIAGEEICGNLIDENCDGNDLECVVVEANVTIVDNLNSSVSYSSGWSSSVAYPGFYGEDYFYSSASAGDWWIWNASLEKGRYKVYVWYVGVEGRAVDSVYEVSSLDGVEGVVVDQSGFSGDWELLGEFNFSGGSFVRLVSGVSTEGACADAVRFLRVGDLIEEDISVGSDNSSSDEVGDDGASGSGGDRDGFYLEEEDNDSHDDTSVKKFDRINFPNLSVLNKNNLEWIVRGFFAWVGVVILTFVGFFVWVWFKFGGMGLRGLGR